MRLPGFDYSQAGAYFVTIVAQDRKPLFGQIVAGEMVLNEVGEVVKEVWVDIPEHFPNVELGEFVVMPNHFHGIIIITVGATHASHLRSVPSIKPMGPIPGSLGAIIGSFKSAATKRVHGFTNYKEGRLWQRNYYEHVIRNDQVRATPVACPNVSRGCPRKWFGGHGVPCPYRVSHNGVPCRYKCRPQTPTHNPFHLIGQVGRLAPQRGGFPHPAVNELCDGLKK